MWRIFLIFVIFSSIKALPMMLQLFPFTLIGEAKAWMKSLEPDSITTWEEFRTKFITRYFPPVKADKVKTNIMSFTQNGDETLVKAWERFKRMLRMCPNHGIAKRSLIQIFYPHNQQNNPRPHQEHKQSVGPKGVLTR